MPGVPPQRVGAGEDRTIEWPPSTSPFPQRITAISSGGDDGDGGSGESRPNVGLAFPV